MNMHFEKANSPVQLLITITKLDIRIRDKVIKDRVIKIRHQIIRAIIIVKTMRLLEVVRILQMQHCHHQTLQLPKPLLKVHTVHRHHQPLLTDKALIIRHRHQLLFMVDRQVQDMVVQLVSTRFRAETIMQKRAIHRTLILQKAL